MSSKQDECYDAYFRGPTYPPKIAENLIEEVKRAIEESTREVLKLSPYGKDSLPIVLGHQKTRHILEEGFVDQWGRRWILSSFDSGALPHVLRFKPVMSLGQTVLRIINRLIHPLSR